MMIASIMTASVCCLVHNEQKEVIIAFG
jgi:hypothetical protein